MGATWPQASTLSRYSGETLHGNYLFEINGFKTMNSSDDKHTSPYNDKTYKNHKTVDYYRSEIQFKTYCYYIPWITGSTD